MQKQQHKPKMTKKKIKRTSNFNLYKPLSFSSITEAERKSKAKVQKRFWALGIQVSIDTKEQRLIKRG